MFGMCGIERVILYQLNRDVQMIVYTYSFTINIIILYRKYYYGRAFCLRNFCGDELIPWIAQTLTILSQNTLLICFY